MKGLCPSMRNLSKIHYSRLRLRPNYPDLQAHVSKTALWNIVEKYNISQHPSESRGHKGPLIKKLRTQCFYVIHWEIYYNRQYIKKITATCYVDAIWRTAREFFYVSFTPSSGSRGLTPKNEQNFVNFAVEGIDTIESSKQVGKVTDTQNIMRRRQNIFSRACGNVVFAVLFSLAGLVVAGLPVLVWIVYSQCDLNGNSFPDSVHCETQVGWLIASCFVGVTLPISIWEIVMHLRYMYSPALQVIKFY